MHLQLANTQPPALAHRVIARQQHVVCQPHGGHGTTAQAFFRHKVQAQLAALLGVQAPCRFASHLNHVCPGSCVFARQRIEQLALAIARDTGNTQHLTSTHFKPHVNQVHAELILLFEAQATDMQHNAASLHFTVLQRWWFGTNHQARQRSIGFFLRIAVTRHLAATQHRTGGAQLANFVQLVADVQDRTALRGQLLEHHKQFVYRLRCEHGRWLIQDQYAWVSQQSANDFHTLHLTHRQGVHRAQGINIHAVFSALGFNACSHLCQRHALVQAQPDILCNGQRVKQAEVLKHHGNTVLARLLGVANVDGLAIKQHLTFIRLDRAVDDLHQRGLACTVFTQHGVYFTGLHRQRYPVIGHHGRVSLGNAHQLQARWHGTGRGDGLRGIHARDCFSFNNSCEQTCLAADLA